MSDKPIWTNLCPSLPPPLSVSPPLVITPPAISSGNAWSCPSWMTSVSKCWRSVTSLWGCRCPMRSTSAWRSFYCSAQVLQYSSLWTVVPPHASTILLTTIVLYYDLVAPATWKQCHFFFFFLVLSFSVAQRLIMNVTCALRATRLIAWSSVQAIMDQDSSKDVHNDLLK